jgi:hypothetical protein
MHLYFASSITTREHMKPFECEEKPTFLTKASDKTSNKLHKAIVEAEAEHAQRVSTDEDLLAMRRAIQQQQQQQQMTSSLKIDGEQHSLTGECDVDKNSDSDVVKKPRASALKARAVLTKPVSRAQAEKTRMASLTPAQRQEEFEKTKLCVSSEMFC